MGAATLSEIPIVEHILQASRAIGHHTLIVDFNRNDTRTLGLCRVGGIHVDEELAQHGGPVLDCIPVLIPRLGKEFDSLVETIGRAAGEDDLWSVEVGHIGMEMVASELADERLEGRVA